MTEAPFDLQRAQRWFGVEFNNLAWELIEADTRTPDEVERMIQLAHASCLHWQHVGKPINHQRGYGLLAYAYLAAGIAERALHYARRGFEMSEAGIEGQEEFDRATALGAMAMAHHLAGDSDEAERFRALTHDAQAKLTHPDDVSVFEKLYRDAVQ